MAVIDIDHFRERRTPRFQRTTRVSEQKSAESAPSLPSAWAARRRYRRMLRTELLLQPDSVLEDAGITREDALLEARKPFWRA